MTPRQRYCYAYPRPAVTVDVVLVRPGPRGLQVLLIQRRDDPFAGSFALPGGFLDMDEELEAAARRELLEETGLEVGTMRELGAFGTVGRDPRGRTVSVVYLVLHPGEDLTPRAGDDAAAVQWRSLKRPPKLAFDHALVLASARRQLRELVQRAPIADELAASNASRSDRARIKRWLITL